MAQIMDIPGNPGWVATLTVTGGGAGIISVSSTASKLVSSTQTDMRGRQPSETVYATL